MMPTIAEMEKAMRGDQGVTMVFMPANQVIASGMVTPKMTPSAPPAPESRTVSTRNWMMMSRRLAPSARRMPISRVRSVTLASMMFMMPIPPTSRDMAAMAPRTILKMRLVRSAWRSNSRGTTTS